MSLALASAYFVTIVPGFVVVTLSLLLHARFASPAYLYWALIMLGGTLLIMANASAHYLTLTGSGTHRYLLLSFFIFSLSGELLLGYCVPQIAYGVAGMRIPVVRSALHLLVVAGLGALVIVEGLTRDDVVAAVRIIVRIVWIGYGYAVLISGTRTITDKSQRAVIRAFLTTGSVVLPIMLSAELASLLLTHDVALRSIPVASLLWLSAYSALSVVLVVRFIFGPHSKVNGPVSDLFVKTFSISDREREIIRFILQGNTEAHTGDLLFISRRTVVNHVYSIYRKTGVSNRVQLINLVNTYALPDPGQWPLFTQPR
jgi:DNA-binding CsgD family transcriptional regulator